MTIAANYEIETLNETDDYSQNIERQIGIRRC